MGGIFLSTLGAFVWTLFVATTRSWSSPEDDDVFFEKLREKIEPGTESAIFVDAIERMNTRINETLAATVGVANRSRKRMLPTMLYWILGLLVTTIFTAIVNDAEPHLGMEFLRMASAGLQKGLDIWKTVKLPHF